MHVPRAALLSDAMVTSSCIPICSKICEVCFDVATALTMPQNSASQEDSATSDCFATLQSSM